jgi:hypothetical protein
VDRQELGQILDQYFNEEELRDICFDLGIDAEMLCAPSSPKSKLVRKLIIHFEQRMALHKLIGAIVLRRDNEFWRKIFAKVAIDEGVMQPPLPEKAYLDGDDESVYFEFLRDALRDVKDLVRQNQRATTVLVYVTIVLVVLSLIGGALQFLELLIK